MGERKQGRRADFGDFLASMAANDELPADVLDILISELIECGYVKIIGATKGCFVYDLTLDGARRSEEIRRWLKAGPYPDPPSNLQPRKRR